MIHVLSDLYEKLSDNFGFNSFLTIPWRIFTNPSVFDNTDVARLTFPKRKQSPKGGEFADAKNVHPYEFFNRFQRIDIVGGTHCCWLAIAYVRTQRFRNTNNRKCNRI